MHRKAQEGGAIHNNKEKLKRQRQQKYRTEGKH
jgi:hypothetical protein